MQLKLISLLGLVVFVGIAWAISSHRKLFPWRTVAWGLGLQFVFGFLILKTSAGERVFDFFQRGVTKLISFADDGSKMVVAPGDQRCGDDSRLGICLVRCFDRKCGNERREWNLRHLA